MLGSFFVVICGLAALTKPVDVYKYNIGRKQENETIKYCAWAICFPKNLIVS